MQPIQDWHLILAVVALLVIDVVIIGVYTIMEGVSGHLHVEQVLNRENQEEIKGVSVLRTVFKVGHTIKRIITQYSIAM